MRPARISITGKLCKKLESIDAKILIPNERFLLRFPRCKSKDLETTFYIIVSFEKFKTSVIFLHAFIGHTIKLRYYFLSLLSSAQNIGAPNFFSVINTAQSRFLRSHFMPNTM